MKHSNLVSYFFAFIICASVTTQKAADTTSPRICISTSVPLISAEDAKKPSCPLNYIKTIKTAGEIVDFNIIDQQLITGLKNGLIEVRENFYSPRYSKKAYFCNFFPDNKAKLTNLCANKHYLLAISANYQGRYTVKYDGVFNNLLAKDIIYSGPNSIKCGELYNNTMFISTSGHSIEAYNIETSAESKKYNQPGTDIVIKHHCVGNNTLYSLKNDLIAYTLKSQDNNTLYAGCSENTVQKWDLLTKKVVTSWNFVSDKCIITALALNPVCSSLLAMSNNSGNMYFVDEREEMGLSVKIGVHNQRINKLVFTPDGKFLLSASEDMSVKIWDTNTRTLFDTMTFKKAVKSICVTPQALIVGSGSKLSVVKNTLTSN